LGGFLALGCAFYTAIIAVRVSKADEADRLSILAFLGVMIPVGLQWVGTTAVAGLYYIIVVALNRTSLWAKVPHAIKHRDGRFFCNIHMVIFNWVCAILWVYYGIAISDVYLALNSIIALGFLTPCIVLKVALHPRLCGKPVESLEAPPQELGYLPSDESFDRQEKGNAPAPTESPLTFPKFKQSEGGDSVKGLLSEEENRPSLSSIFLDESGEGKKLPDPSTTSTASVLHQVTANLSDLTGVTTKPVLNSERPRTFSLDSETSISAPQRFETRSVASSLNNELQATSLSRASSIGATTLSRGSSLESQISSPARKNGSGNNEHNIVSGTSSGNLVDLEAPLDRQEPAGVIPRLEPPPVSERSSSLGYEATMAKLEPGITRNAPLPSGSSEGGDENLTATALSRASTSAAEAATSVIQEEERIPDSAESFPKSIFASGQEDKQEAGLLLGRLSGKDCLPESLSISIDENLRKDPDVSIESRLQFV